MIFANGSGSCQAKGRGQPRAESATDIIRHHREATTLGLDGIRTDGADQCSALDSISSRRADFGVAQNRVESAIRSLDVQIENLSTARSRIFEVDVAAEASDLIAAQILQQAGIAVLAQAIEMPRLALRLLQR